MDINQFQDSPFTKLKPGKLEEERGKVKKVSCFIEPISFGLTQQLLMGAKNFLSSQRSSSSRPIE